jgi:hypothetical protein
MNTFNLPYLNKLVPSKNQDDAVIKCESGIEVGSSNNFLAISGPHLILTRPLYHITLDLQNIYNSNESSFC